MLLKLARRLCGKDLSANAGDTGDIGSIFELGVSPGQRNTHLSIRAWRIPRTDESGWLVHGVAKSHTCLCTHTFS